MQAAIRLNGAPGAPTTGGRNPGGCAFLGQGGNRLVEVYGAKVIQAKGIAQDLDVSTQLAEGIRCFDLRACREPGDQKFYTHHQAIGAPVADALAQIRAFLATATNEVVLIDLAISGQQDTDLQNNLALVALAKDCLSGYLFSRPDATTRLASLTPAQITAAGAKAVVLFNSPWFGQNYILQTSPTSCSRNSTPCRQVSRVW